MEKLIQGFAAQMQAAMEIGSAASIRPADKEIRNVCLIGMGGSAFGGEVVRNYISSTCKVPFDIVRDYELPGYVSEHTLVIVSSYSGCTEETLSALSVAQTRTPRVICITSGGDLAGIAKDGGYDCILIPKDYPPRTAAGYSIIQQLYVLRRLGLIEDFTADLHEAIDLIDKFDGHEDAHLIAEQLHDRIPILYSSPKFESIAIRWRQQIEENAKQIAFHHVIPEMNHNELVGWKHPEAILDDASVVILRSPLDHARNQRRMEISREVMGDYADTVMEVYPEGESHLAQLFYLLHLGDWVSLYLAARNGVDATPVDVIDFLKAELAKQ